MTLNPKLEHEQAPKRQSLATQLCPTRCNKRPHLPATQPHHEHVPDGRPLLAGLRSGVRDAGGSSGDDGGHGTGTGVGASTDPVAGRGECGMPVSVSVQPFPSPLSPIVMSCRSRATVGANCCCLSPQRAIKVKSQI